MFVTMLEKMRMFVTMLEKMPYVCDDAVVETIAAPLNPLTFPRAKREAYAPHAPRNIHVICMMKHTIEKSR